MTCVAAWQMRDQPRNTQSYLISTYWSNQCLGARHTILSYLYLLINVLGPGTQSYLISTYWLTSWGQGITATCHTSLRLCHYLERASFISDIHQTSLICFTPSPSLPICDLEWRSRSISLTCDVRGSRLLCQVWRWLNSFFEESGWLLPSVYQWYSEPQSMNFQCQVTVEIWFWCSLQQFKIIHSELHSHYIHINYFPSQFHLG